MQEIENAERLDGGKIPLEKLANIASEYGEQHANHNSDWGDAVTEADIKEAYEEAYNAAHNAVSKHRGGYTYHRDKKKHKAAKRNSKAGRKANRKR